MKNLRALKRNLDLIWDTINDWVILGLIVIAAASYTIMLLV
jgi:hypothetical protein